MIKIDKKFSYIIGILIMVVILIAGGNSLTSKDKAKEDKRTKQDYAEIYLDDQLIELRKNPVIKDEKVYVDIVEFGEALDMDVEVESSEKTIMKKLDKSLVVNTKDNTMITQNNQTFFIDKIKDGKKTLVSINTILEQLQFEVSPLNNNAVKIYSENTKVKSENEHKNDDIVDNKNEENVKESKEDSSQQKEAEQTEKKVAYLTFDDGPNKNTPAILDILKENNVKATFFMLGSSIEEHKEIAKRINDEGHGIGVHSMTHVFDNVYSSPEAFIHEMTITNDLLSEITGEKTFLLRAPYGSKPYMKQEFRDLATSWGYRIWDWNVDSRDSIKKNTAPQEVYNEIVNQVPNKNEAVILFHDKEHTVEALPNIIEFLKTNGYQIKELNDDIKPVNFWNDFR